MTDAEGSAFEANPRAKAILKMRTFDEAAKVVGLTVPGLDAYALRIQALLRASTEGLDVEVRA